MIEVNDIDRETPEHETDRIIALIPTFTKDELLQTQTYVQGKVADIRTQIDAAKAKRIATGEWSDPIWYAKATAARRYWGRVDQAIVRRISELNRQHRSAGSLEQEMNDKKKAFMRAAASMLGPRTFTRIAKAAGFDDHAISRYLESVAA